MRWLFLAATLLSALLCATRHGPGALAFWLLISVLGIFATGLLFAQARIEGQSREQSLSEYDLKRLREGKPPIRHTRSTGES